ncbi:hypothetical protein JCGZ_07936 [Jatropha curcas]|uniref:Peptidase S8/S53 domain-containing protein n=1 Tax=Jatropha curcas TaxID=180498 RepID=A0A067KZA3_JATCU|nr:hypothetical protein JCGZ_07936 [Jatropha curcas]
MASTLSRDAWRAHLDVNDLSNNLIFQCWWGSKPTSPRTSSTPLPPPAAAHMPSLSTIELAAYERQMTLSKTAGAEALMLPQSQHALKQAVTGMGAVGSSLAIYDSKFPNVATSQQIIKIIEARYYYQGFEAENGPLEAFAGIFFQSARDGDGHGSHTASPIGGVLVPNSSLFGMASGTTRGGAPNLRFAIYKACWFNLCSDVDILSAMDDAINDGVDILLLSLGPDPPQPIYFQNAISIGAFHAFRKGVLVACSAGNSFFPGTATNVAPWILTVAASSLDREFNSNVYLGNSIVLKGFSLNPLKTKTSNDLIAGSDAAAPGVPAKNASFCKNNTLDYTKIQGKIVACIIKDVKESRGEKALFIQ